MAAEIRRSNNNNGLIWFAVIATIIVLLLALATMSNNKFMCGIFGCSEEGVHLMYKDQATAYYCTPHAKQMYRQGWRYSR